VTDQVTAETTETAPAAPETQTVLQETSL